MELQHDGRRLQLTQLGKAHYGGVSDLFYAPHVQRHLMELDGGETNPTKYLSETKALGALVRDDSKSAAVDPKRPYAGNPLPRYERKRMKRKDSRANLPSDWALSSSSSSVANPTRHSYSSWSSKGANHKLQELKQDKYESGNILFSGPCNQKCIFCIGQQLPGHLSPRNHRIWPPTNLDIFIQEIRSSDTKRIILTGTTADPQLYKYEERLLHRLRESIPGAHISVHTNGLLALRKLDVFNQYDTATISINSLNPETFSKMHGVAMEMILANAKPPIKLSCVLTSDNNDEVESYLATASNLGVTRVALRPVLGLMADDSSPTRPPPTLRVLDGLVPVRQYCGNPVYDVEGVEVTYWEFDQTSGKSLNLFANGLLSQEYLLSKASGETPTSFS
eukprot:scaffold7012_cov157-Amphora_coffeaeformis.AAC.24